MEPEDLTVIGHTGDLLVDIYARNLTHIYILPQCSTTAARVLNPAGMDAQFERLRCAISRGILIELSLNKNLSFANPADRIIRVSLFAVEFSFTFSKFSFNFVSCSFFVFFFVLIFFSF